MTAQDAYVTPTAGSQQAGLDVLFRIAAEQAAETPTQVIPADRTAPMKHAHPVVSISPGWPRFAAWAMVITAVAVWLTVFAAGGLRAAPLPAAHILNADAVNQHYAEVQGLAGYRPTSVAGPGWTCTYTNPEYMIHSGGADLAVDPGQAAFTVTGRTSPAMTGPYITAGYEGDLNSSLCNKRELPGSGGRHGESFALPQRLGKQGHPVAAFTGWTSPDFRGDAGFDLWLTASPKDTTYTQMANGGAGTTEIMVWMSHPKLGSYRYYHVRIDGRWWAVTVGLAANGHGRSAAHPNGWTVVNFIAPQTADGNVSTHGLSLDQFMSYAITHGWLNQHDYLMSVNMGFEDFKGTGAVDGYTMTGLK